MVRRLISLSKPRAGRQHGLEACGSAPYLGGGVEDLPQALVDRRALQAAERGTVVEDAAGSVALQDRSVTGESAGRQCRPSDHVGD